MSNTESTKISAQSTIPFAPTKIAFDKHQAFIVAIKPEDTRDARVDVNAVFVRTLIVLGALHEMRPLIVARLPDVPLPVYDSIEERIHAAHYCNTLWQAKVKGKEDVGVLADVLEDRYDEALSAYGTLIKFRLASEAPLAQLRPMTGHEALMHNASLLLGVLRGLTPDLLSQTPLRGQGVDQLEHDLLAVQGAWGRREYAELERDEAAVLRAQAFTYLYDAYELARRAAMYLYGLERANQLVPSLFVSNGERRRKAGDEGATDPNAGAPSAPTETNAQQPAPTTQAASKSSAKPNEVTPATFVMDNTANLPLTNPFDLSNDKK
jgi:hypothetical protein